jgi:integrase
MLPLGYRRDGQVLSDNLLRILSGSPFRFIPQPLFLPGCSSRPHPGYVLVRAKKVTYLPVVMSREEVKRLLSCMDSQYLFMAQAIYGCGLRLSECLRLRVKDIDFDSGPVMVHSGKVDKDRSLVLPEALLNA